MNESNKKALKELIVNLEEEWEFYHRIGEECNAKCINIDAQIKSNKVMAFRDTNSKAKIVFSKLREV